MQWPDDFKTWFAENRPYSPYKAAQTLVDDNNWFFLQDLLGRTIHDNPAAFDLAAKAVTERTQTLINTLPPHHLRHFRDTMMPFPPLAEDFQLTLGKALPELLDRKDFMRFNALYFLSFDSPALAQHFTPFIVARAATAMRDNGYPLDFEYLHNMALNNPQLHKTLKRISEGAVIDSTLRNTLGAREPDFLGYAKQLRLSVIFTDKGVFCQDEQINAAGMKPIEMVSHWRAVVPHEAEALSRKLERILHDRSLHGNRAAKKAYDDLKSLDAG